MSSRSARLAPALLALIVGGAAVAPVSALAQPSWHRETRTPHSFVGLDRLTATLDDNQLHVDVEMDPSSWRQLQQDGITPTFALLVPGRDRRHELRQTFSVSRMSARLTMTFDGRGPRVDEVEIAIGGRSDRGTVDGFELGGVAMRRIVVPVTGRRWGSPRPTPGGRPPTPTPVPTRWAAEPAVIQACGAGFDGATNESTCLDLVAGSGLDPRPALAACDALMDGDPNELACLGIALSARVDRTAALQRCEAGYDGDAAELQCFRTVLHTRWEPSAAIDACDVAASGDPNEQACLEVAARAGADPTATIQACDQSMSGDDALLACMRRAMP